MRKLSITDMHRMTTDEFRCADKMPLTVVLDNVRSMHNVGSVLRTADAFRIERVIMCGITSTPPHPELHKTALGAEDAVEWTYYEDTHRAIDDLRAENYTLYAVEQCESSVMLQNLSLQSSSRYAIVLGNEVHGVQQTVIDLCDGCIEIPQFGTKHSLNVSVAAGVVMWEFAKRLLLTVSLVFFCLTTDAQQVSDTVFFDIEDMSVIMPQWHIKRTPEFYDGEWLPVIVLPEIPVYAPIKFKNKKQRQRYDRLVINVKTTLPLAKQAREIVMETYDVLKMLPDEKSRKAHMLSVERNIKREFTPKMKKLTYSQGKLLIKLIDRECHQSSYELIQAFLGPTKAFFYQIFAWTFKASLKKTYDPQGDDRMIERIVRQVETGAI